MATKSTMAARRIKHFSAWQVLALLPLLAALTTCTTSDDIEDESGFPDSLPSGDPWAYDVTWFHKEPEHAYVMRNKPSTLVCRAASALKVFFKCNGKVVPNSKQVFQNFTHTNTGSPITEVQLNVTKEEVHEYTGPGKYSCECVAWNKRGEKRSQSATIEVAYLKRYFEQSPYSQNVAIDSQTELRCIPPDGVPQSVITWIRDGIPIDPKRDSNYIVSSEGHLLIAQTRLSDMGNYSCVAENIASRRVSEPALLTVYVNGDWSNWSPWGECQGSCGRGVQRKTRKCNSPAPLNGGRPCVGKAFMEKDCPLPCPPVDGRWTPWTLSTCGPDCKQVKRRSCSSPAPAHGGRSCVGKDSLTVNCTGGLCREGGDVTISMEPAQTSDQAARAVAETDIALYIGLGVAIVVFTIVALVVIRLMRNKRGDHVTYDMAPSDYPPGYFPDPSKKLSMQPDLTVNTSGTGAGMGLPLCYEYTYPGALGNNKDNGPLTPDHSEHHYDVPHLHLQPGALTAAVAVSAVNALSSPLHSSTKDGESSYRPIGYHYGSHRLEKTSEGTLMERLPRSVSSDSVSSSFSSSEPSRPNSLMYDENESRLNGIKMSNNNNNSNGMDIFRDSIASTSLLLDSLDPECVAWTTANSTGCRITLKDSAINLTIPDGGLSKTEELYCAILTEEKDRPPLTAGQTLLSPVISCGPRNVHMKKPAILSFQHCAALKYGGWTISLYHQESSSSTSSSSRHGHNNSLISNSSNSSNSSGENSAVWKKLATVGEETIHTPVFIQLDSNQVFLVSDRLDKFALVGESEAGKNAVKTLRLAAFAPAQAASSSGSSNGTINTEYTIRVYILDDTIAALERVMSQEKRLGGKVLDKPRSLLFQDGGENLCISLEDVGSGWRCKSQGSYQELPFNQVWSCRQSDLHCSFTLEKTDRRTSAICFRLLAWQKNVQLQRQTFRIRTELGSIKSRTSHTIGMVNSSPEVTIGGPPAKSSTVTTSSGCSSLVTLEPGSPLFRLPLTLKRRLCNCLDQPHPSGKDWRLLAQKLGVDRYINYLTMKSSPTEHILDLWDVKNRKPEAITDLLNALRLMERQDAVAILEKEMGPWI